MTLFRSTTHCIFISVTWYYYWLLIVCLLFVFNEYRYMNTGFLVRSDNNRGKYRQFCCIWHGFCIRYRYVKLFCECDCDIYMFTLNVNYSFMGDHVIVNTVVTRIQKASQWTLIIYELSSSFLWSFSGFSLFWHLPLVANIKIWKSHLNIREGSDNYEPCKSESSWSRLLYINVTCHYLLVIISLIWIYAGSWRRLKQPTTQ